MAECFIADLTAEPDNAKLGLLLINVIVHIKSSMQQAVIAEEP